jgi:hypothetical protein
LRPIVYCADVGSIGQKNFGWARVDPDAKDEDTGERIEELAVAIADDLNANRPVALGFECPLWAPLPAAPERLGKARRGETEKGVNRPWSGGPGAAVLATGAAQVPWVLRRIGDAAPARTAFLDWGRFQKPRKRSGLFLWEAFVTGRSKGRTHKQDALLGARAFVLALPDPRESDVSAPSDSGEEAISLVGAAMVQTGWSRSNSTLGERAIVIRATSSARARL